MTQWRMPMNEILKLTSTDYWQPVHQILNMVDIGDEYHQRLKEKMRQDKINKVPIYIWEPSWDLGIPNDNLEDKRILGNGHHRVRIAFEDGWKEMVVTDDGSESGWGNLQGVVVE